MKLFSLILVTGIFHFATHAQMGMVTLGSTNIGYDSLFVPDIAKARTPVCAAPGPCNSNCSVYTFIGNGNWSIDGNWMAGIKPPVQLSGCVQIVISPVAGGECLLNVPLQIIPAGASITVASGKRFRIPGLLLRQ